MTEDELLTAIVDAAHLFGWLVYHVRNSKAGVIQGTPGFPDLVLARRGRLIFAELKTESGRLTYEQVAWQREIREAIDWDSLCATPFAYYLWRPSDLDHVLEVLQ